MNKMSTERLTGQKAEAPELDEAPRPGLKRYLRPLMLFVVPALIVIGLGYYWLASGGSVSTDDAQVKQDIVSVSPQVNGQVVEVLVRNGAQVKRGQLLFRIDPQPYRVALEQAEAQLATARLQTSQLKTQAAGTGADIIGEQANLSIKRNALGRQAALLKKGFTTRADYEDALNEVRTAEQDLADAHARSANASAAAQMMSAATTRSHMWIGISRWA